MDNGKLRDVFLRRLVLNMAEHAAGHGLGDAFVHVCKSFCGCGPEVAAHGAKAIADAAAPYAAHASLVAGVGVGVLTAPVLTPLAISLAVFGVAQYMEQARKARNDRERDEAFAEIMRVADAVAALRDEQATATDRLMELADRRSPVWARINGADQADFARRLLQEIQPALELVGAGTEETLRGHWLLNTDTNDRIRALQEMVNRLLKGGRISPSNQRVGFCWSGKPALPRHLVERPRERAALDEAVQGGSAPVVVVCAIGGQGKTTLVADWLANHEKTKLFPFEGVCYFSAYRFGVDYVGFLEFSVESLQSGDLPKNASIAVLSRMLIDVMSQRRVLLVLDGIERWLHGGEGLETLRSVDEERDRSETEAARGFGHFLESIAGLQNGSRLVLTTRAFPRALDHVEGSAAIRIGGSSTGLPGMDEREGLLLLDRLGAVGSDSEKQACVREIEGHPLSITVLAGILKKLGKSVNDRATVYPLLQSHEHKLRSILMHAESLCGVDLPVLQVAALCPEDAPVDALVAGLDRAPSRAQLQLRLSQLEQWGLVALAGQHRELIQMHPLVRAHFAATVLDGRLVHGRLSGHFASVPISAKARSLSRVSPRLWAVEHAAAAGDFERALQLLQTQPLVESGLQHTSDGGVGRLTLSKWFQAFGQSAFELEWTRRLAHGAPQRTRAILLNSMAIAARSMGDIDMARRLVDEGLALIEDDHGA